MRLLLTQVLVAFFAFLARRPVSLSHICGKEIFPGAIDTIIMMDDMRRREVAVSPLFIKSRKVGRINNSGRSALASWYMAFSLQRFSRGRGNAALSHAWIEWLGTGIWARARLCDGMGKFSHRWARTISIIHFIGKLIDDEILAYFLKFPCTLICLECSNHVSSKIGPTPIVHWK